MSGTLSGSGQSLLPCGRVYSGRGPHRYLRKPLTNPRSRPNTWRSKGQGLHLAVSATSWRISRFMEEAGERGGGGREGCWGGGGGSSQAYAQAMASPEISGYLCNHTGSASRPVGRMPVTNSPWKQT